MEAKKLTVIDKNTSTYIMNNFISNKEHHSVVRFCKEKLIDIGLTHLGRSSIKVLKHKVLINLYINNFSSSPLDDYRLAFGEEDINYQKETVYIIGNRKEGKYKIGFSLNAKKRLKQLQTGCGFKLELIAVFKGSKKTEKALHFKYKNKKILGEWFTFTKSEIDFISDNPLNLVNKDFKFL